MKTSRSCADAVAPRPGVIRPAILLVLLLAGVARGARDPSEEARRHYERALTYYQQEQYREALAEMEASYRIKQLPRLLLNMGQLHRKMGHASEALDYYARYLAADPSVSPAVRSDIESHISALRSIQLTMNRSPASLDAANVLPFAPLLEADRRTRFRRRLFWGLFSGGISLVAIAVGVGVGFGVGESRPRTVYFDLSNQLP